MSTVNPPDINSYGLAFHHLGLAVKASAPATAFLTALGYRIGGTVFDPLQNVNLKMCEHVSMPWVEVIYPGDSQGPLDKMLNRHKDGLVYHMCYTTRNLEKSLAAMSTDEKLQPFCVSEPKAAILFDNAPVSFYRVPGIGLIEIIEADSRHAQK